MKINLFSKEEPLHLFYFPVLFVVNHFFAIVTPGKYEYVNSFWMWLLNFLGAVIVSGSISYVVFRIISLKLTKMKSALLTTALCFPFFFYQDILIAAEQLFILGLRSRVVLPIFFLCFVGLCFWIIRGKRTFFSLNQYLNIVSFSLIAYTSFTLIYSFDYLRPKVLSYSPPVSRVTCENCPDIYFLLLDSYTSNKSLADYFQYSNAGFTEQLEGLDFKVADQANSGYARTLWSLCAILNFNEIKDLNDYGYGLKKALQENAVVASLQKAEYEIHNYSMFDIDSKPSYYSLGPAFPVTCINGIIESSILNMVVYDMATKLNGYAIHSDILKKMRDASSKERIHPKFVYGHILAPHPPFVIDANGENISFSRQKKYMGNPNSYVIQVQGLNKMVVESVKEIIAASPNAVIVIMGDHGYRYLEIPDKKKESHTVFLAYRGPNKESLDSLSQSNEIFKLVFKDLVQDKKVD